MSQPSKNVVLVGAGHAHLHLARHLNEFTQRGIELTLIDPGAFWYSGMATGMLGGEIPSEADSIEPAPLLEQQGGRFLHDRVIGLDRHRKYLQIASGASVAYDVVSFNVGSEVPVERIPGAVEYSWPVKPIAGLTELCDRLVELYQRKVQTSIVIVGGGPTGCEVAANIQALASRYAAEPRITLCNNASRLIPAWPARAAAALQSELSSRGIDVKHHCRVSRCYEGHVRTEAGQSIPADLTVLATGLRAPRLMQRLGLPAHESEGLVVNSALQSHADPNVFAAGDCMHFAYSPLPKVGVFGVRAGAILQHNLLARLEQRRLEHFNPQKRYLIILNLGHGRALAMRGRWWWLGRWPLRLKHRIDQQFMAKHRQPA